MKCVNNHPFRSLGVLVLAFYVSFAGFCGAARAAALRSALKSAPAFINSLVVNGKVSRDVADGSIKDFTDGADTVLKWDQCLGRVPKNSSDEKRQQFKCTRDAFTEWRSIVARGHFKANKDINDVFLIADGLFEFIDAFYADRAGAATHSDVGADGLSDEDFNREVDRRIGELKARLKR
jgi:hypothetical protein